MDQIIITKPDDSTWALVTKSNVTAVTRAEQKRTLLGEDVVTMTVESAVKLTFGIGDRITVFGNTYLLNALPKLLKGGKRKFTYDITWEGRQYDLLKPLYLDEGADEISISPDFALTGNLDFFMDVLINNCKRIYGTGVWVLGDCPETDYRTLTFSNENCLAVLQRLCKKENFDKEFEIIENSGVFTINIKAAIGSTHPTTYEYGKSKGLWNLTRETVSDKNIITRLYVFGSNKNLNSDYRGFSQRLKLPGNDLSYIEDQDAIDAYGLIEGVKLFDTIYPHRPGTVSSLGGSVDEFFDTSMDFDLEAVDGGGNSLYLINGVVAKLHFNTGNLAGYEFEILWYDHDLKKFKIKSFTDERGQIFPDPDTSAFQIAIGDKYVITDITMPESYETAAETELDTAADALYPIVSQPRVQYSQTFDELYFKQKYTGQSTVNVFGIGDNVHIKDTDIGVDKLIRLRSFKRDVIHVYRYDLDLYDYSEEALASQLVSASNEASKVISRNKLDEAAGMNRSQTSQQMANFLLDCFEIINPGTSTEYLRVKLPIGCDYEIQAFSDSGQLPPGIWESLPVASASVLGCIKVGSGLSITDGILSVSSGGGMVYPGAGIALSTGSAWGTPITNNSANWNTAYGWGNHASAGYAAGSHNHAGVYDPAGTGHTEAATHVGSHESTYSHTNYNTAYGWGNHASAGYAAGSHNHDGVYAPTAHIHDDRYFTETEINAWFELTGEAPNQYLRVKLPIGCDYEIQAFSDSGQLPPGIWESLPVASASVLGCIKVGSGLSITDGILSVSSGGGMVYPGAGIALSTGSAWGTPITNNSANWNTAYGWGNHASAGYAAGSHNHAGVYDPAGTGHTEAATHVGSHESTYSHTNYNTAYGWGNHASAGYAAGSHNHDGVYAPTAHIHDDRYFTETEINAWFELTGEAPNQYLRVKLPIGCDYEIQAFSDSGQLPPGIWESLPVASASVLGCIKVGSGLSITDGILSVSSGGGMVYPGAGIALSTGSAWGTPITNNSANWNTAYGWGNHASAGYAAGSHNHAGVYDPAGTAAAVVGSHESTYSHANFVTAYGWGNHASAGYAQASHTHDDRYYTETEINTTLASKADLSGGVVSATQGGTGVSSLFKLFKTFIDTGYLDRSLETMMRPVLIRNVERINYPWPASETKWKVTAHDTTNKIITLDRDLPIEISDFGPDPGRRWQLQNSTNAGSNIQITDVDWINKKIYYITLRGSFAVNDYVSFWNPFRNFILNPFSYIIGTNSWATLYTSPGGIWLHSDGDYRMIVNGWDGSHGMTGLYKSSDLLTWTAVSGSYYYHAGVHPFDEAWCIGGATHWSSCSPVKVTGTANYAKQFQGLNASGRGEIGIVIFNEDFGIVTMPTSGITIPGYTLDSIHHYYPGGLAYFNDNLYLSMRYRNTSTGVDKILIMKYDISTNTCSDVEEVCDNEPNAYTELTAQHSCPFVFNSELFVLVGGENSTATPPIGVTNEIFGFFHKRYGTWQPYTQNPFISNPMYGEYVYSGCDWAIDHMGASPCLIQRGNYLHLFVSMNQGTDSYKVAKMDMLLPL